MRNFLPPDRVSVPDTWPIFLRTVCLTVVYRVSLGFYQFAAVQQFRCNAANLPGAQRAAPAALPWGRVLLVALVFHGYDGASPRASSSAKS